MQARKALRHDESGTPTLATYTSTFKLTGGENPVLLPTEFSVEK